YANCLSGQARLTSWVPAPGYLTDGYSRGPGTSVWLKFKSSDTELTVTATCVAGHPRFTTATDIRGGGGGGEDRHGGGGGGGARGGGRRRPGPRRGLGPPPAPPAAIASAAPAAVGSAIAVASATPLVALLGGRGSDGDRDDRARRQRAAGPHGQRCARRLR